MLGTKNQSTRSFWYSAVVLMMAAVGLWWGAQLNTTSASQSSGDNAGNDAVFNADAASLGAIPDNAPTNPRNVTFTVSGLSGAPTNVEVSMTFGAPIHTYVGDITAILIAPNGASHVVFSRTGTTSSTSFGDSSDLVGPYNFKDSATGTNWWAAAAAVGATVAIPSGDYRTTAAGPQPAANNSPVTNMSAAFAGVTNPNGTWTLRLTDNATGDTGAISAAALTIDAATTPPTGGFDNRLDYFNNNNLSDWAVVRAASSSSPITWSILKNENPSPAGPGAATIRTFNFGEAGTDFIPAFGNYTGGAASGDDAAVWRDTTQPAVYYSYDLGTNAATGFAWGTANDFVGGEGDYDNDNIMDPTVVRTDGTLNRWYIFRSSNGTFTTFTFGDAATDFILPGADYNGDGFDDPTVIRIAGDGAISWFTYNLVSGTQIGSVVYGNFDTDFVIPGGDYDGDGKADYAVWRGFSGTAADRGTWYIRYNSGTSTAVNFGIASTSSSSRDTALRHGDYDGDGKTDIAVYRRSTATFYFIASMGGAVRSQQWGVANDIPVASYGTF